MRSSMRTWWWQNKISVGSTSASEWPYHLVVVAADTESSCKNVPLHDRCKTQVGGTRSGEPTRHRMLLLGYSCWEAEEVLGMPSTRSWLVHPMVWNATCLPSDPTCSKCSIDGELWTLHRLRPFFHWTQADLGRQRGPQLHHRSWTCVYVQLHPGSDPLPAEFLLWMLPIDVTCLLE